MKTKFEIFRALHQRNGIFILPNAWNAASALMFQQCNYEAIATSSAAVAQAMGYADGENMPFHEYMLVVKQITRLVTVPVTVDLEMGYGRSVDEVYANIKSLLDVGVSGINIEDSRFINETRLLGDPEHLSQTLKGLRSELAKENKDLFINVRCDTYLLDVKDKLQETSHRLKTYESAGADGVFLPFVREPDHIAAAVSATKLPLNVMVVPDLPRLDELQDLGVKRVSMGPFMYLKTYENARNLAEGVITEKHFKSIV